MALNQEASTLSTLFSHRLLAATTGGALTVTDREAAGREVTVVNCVKR
ncbi:hypothetical protein [Sodalis glossinidius]|nr:hypothetical protein [Sodalis glossinidius]